MNEKYLTIFQYTDKQVRTAMDDQGNPWFCLLDLCMILDISNNRNVVTRLDRNGVCTIDALDLNGKTQKTTFVNEPNMYLVIMQSRKPEAVQFQMWIVNEVLPSIRKTGQYSIKQLSRKEILQMALEAEEKAEKLQAQIESDKPYTETGKSLDNIAGTILIREFVKAHGIKIGEKKFFEWLRKNKILNSKNEPYERYREYGYFILHEHIIKIDGKSDRVKFTPRLTGKGQVWLLNRYNGEQLMIAGDEYDSLEGNNG